MVGRDEIIEQPFNDDSITTYIAYPNEKPFVNSQFVNSKPPSKAFPLSNRDAIIDSLKKMQNKLKNIESTETSLYTAYPVNSQINERRLREDSSNMVDGLMSSFSLNPASEDALVERRIDERPCCISVHLRNIEQINEKTISTENRVNELEKQLEKMRNILNQVSESETVSRRNKKKTKRNQQESKQIEENNEFIKSFTCNKSKSVERNRNVRSKSAHNNVQSQHQNNQHFKLNIGEIPFIVGKSVTPSHNLGTNIQNVISLLKLHNPKMCGSQHQQQLTCLDINNNRVSRQKSRSRSTNSRNNVNHDKVSYCNDSYLNNEFNETINIQSQAELVILDSPTSDSTTTTTLTTSQIDFDELLCVLQEEYTKLVLKHYEMTKQIMNCSDFELRNELEKQSEIIQKKIRIKTRQIEKLKKYQKSQQKINKNRENIDCSECMDPQEEYLNNRPTSSIRNKSNNHETVAMSINNCPNHLKALKLLKQVKNFKQRIQN